MKYISFCTVVLVLFAAGCSQDSSQSSSSDSTVVMDSAPPATVDSHDSHAHASKGPHHGILIELGNEKYHAELVHDEQSVTIYMLDSSAKKANAVEATEVTINLVHDGKPAQFNLPAAPDSDDPAGKSSRFTLQDVKLVEELEHGHAAAKLNILIDGKSYRGEIHHDHEGHDHAH